MDFTFDSCYVDINNVLQTNNYSFLIFPNPGSENFTFQISTPGIKNENCLIKIYNVTGELVNIIPFNINNSSVTVKWDGNGKYADLPAGIYTCSLESNRNVITSQKLIIEK